MTSSGGKRSPIRILKDGKAEDTVDGRHPQTTTERM